MSSEAWTFADLPTTPLTNTPESDSASLSPRSALLSPGYDDATLDRPARFPRGPGERFRRERERIHSTTSTRDLVRLLVNEEYESRQNRKVLYTAFDRLESESRRAAEAESRLTETLQRFRVINEARVAAQQEAARAQEELRLYQMQLGNAQKEIIKAQNVLSTIEAQRDEAEAAAARARSTARRMKEDQLIQVARDEGRRLGFEEGLRRGRTIGYGEGHATGVDDGRSEMKEIAENALDRMLEDREEQEVEEQEPPEEVREPRRRIHNHPSPDVVRVSSPGPSNRNSRNTSTLLQREDTRDSRSRRSSVPPPDISAIPMAMPIPPPGTVGMRSSARSTSAMSGRQSGSGWPERGLSPPSRPLSVQNSAASVHHEDIHVPPDGYIPTLDANSFISLPPPHELHHSIPSPSPSREPSPLPPASPNVRAHDFAYDPVYTQQRRASPESQSQASTKKSQSSTLSQLDIVTFPTVARDRDRRERARNLSVIPEDVSGSHSPNTSGMGQSLRSERMSDYTFSQPAASTPYAGRQSYRNDRDSESNVSTVMTQDRYSKQRFADSLRYSNPSEVEEWRRTGADKPSHSQGPPRARPTNVTTPTPLSPTVPTEEIPYAPPRRHRRSQSAASASQYSDVRSHRRVVSSDSSVPDITIQSPSGPPSDAPSRGGVARGLLSPDHQPIPIPPPNPVIPLVPTVPNTPTAPPISLTGQIYGPPSNFAAPRNTEYGRQGAPPRSSQYMPSPSPDPGRPRSPHSSYTTAPVPSGLSYPQPPISRAATPSGGPAPMSPRSTISTMDPRRGNSMNAGMTPAALGHSRSLSSGPTPTPRVQKNPSNASSTSRRSYSRYDPSSYNDPAYFGSSESLVDPMTAPNTIANAAAGSVRQPQVGPVSPSLSYLTVPGME